MGTEVDPVLHSLVPSQDQRLSRAVHREQADPGHVDHHQPPPIGVESGFEGSGVAPLDAQRSGTRWITDAKEKQRAAVKRQSDETTRWIEAKVVALLVRQSLPRPDRLRLLLRERPQARAAIAVNRGETASVRIEGDLLDIGPAAADRSRRHLRSLDIGEQELGSAGDNQPPPVGTERGPRPVALLQFAAKVGWREIDAPAAGRVGILDDPHHAKETLGVAGIDVGIEPFLRRDDGSQSFSSGDRPYRRIGHGQAKGQNHA